jgi:hypothetical protein
MKGHEAADGTPCERHAGNSMRELRFARLPGDLMLCDNAENSRDNSAMLFRHVFPF